MANNLIYWAAKTPKETVSECMARTTDYYEYINQNNIRFVWALVHLLKFSAIERQSMSFSVGEYNEMQQVRINDFRNLLMHKAGIVKNQRATWEPMAVNDDVTSLAQTKVAKNILEMYTSHKDYDKKFNALVDHTVSFGEAFALQVWDGTKGKITHTMPLMDKKTGKPIMNEDGSPRIINIHEGDVDCRIYEPIDVVRECYVENHDQNKWFIFRDRVNKYDLAAKHPELYEQIVNKTLQLEQQEYYTELTAYGKSSDLINMYTFVHQKTPALPDGRVIQYIDEAIILSSDKLTYDDLPYHRMVDSPIPHTNFSYTDAFDMITIEDLKDGLYSTIISNQAAFGVQNIIMPKGSDISETSLWGQMNLIEYDPSAGGKPEPLNLLATPKEIFETLSILENKLNTISGVNSTAQGNPPNEVSSGVALSMLQSLNVQYAQGAQGSFIEVMTSVGTALLNILKQNAKTERLIEFTGASSRSLLEKFTGKDISSINRVVAKPGNPLSQTIQGRFTIAEMLVQAGMVKDVQELLEVLETGNLDVLTEGAEMALIYAQQENQELQKGNNVQVFQFDDHITHIRKHLGITQDLSVRSGTVTTTVGADGQPQTQTDPKSNPEGQKVLNAVTQHIMEHFKYLNNPQLQPLLAALGYQVGGQPPQQAPPGAAAAGAAQNPSGTIHTHGKTGPSPANGARLPPTAASEQPTTVAQAAGNLEAPVGMIPTPAISTAQRASRPRQSPPHPHKG